MYFNRIYVLSWLILVMFVPAVFGIDVGCNIHYKDLAEVDAYLAQEFLVSHNYMKLGPHQDWSQVKNFNKAYVNNIMIPYNVSSIEFKEANITDDLINGTEIIRRINLPQGHPEKINDKFFDGAALYHGDSMNLDVVIANQGFKHNPDTQIVDLNLIHHLSGKENISRYALNTPLEGLNIRSHFMGATVTPVGLDGLSTWGDFVYDLRGVPHWNINTLQTAKLSSADRALLNSVIGENEYAVPREIPLWCVFRVGNVVESLGAGGYRIKGWQINPHFDYSKCRKYFGIMN